ncbi:MAG: two-component system response regulator [Polyangiales bacterium]
MTTEEVPLILVADDDPDMLALVTRHLRTMKCRLVEATDGDAALEAARKERPDLVVLDVMMPGKSGWEVCKELRDDARFIDTAIVMLTGIGEQLNALTSPLYGADACVDKPFEFGELDFKIKKVLSDRRRAKREREASDVTRPIRPKAKRP